MCFETKIAEFETHLRAAEYAVGRSLACTNTRIGMRSGGVLFVKLGRY